MQCIREIIKNKNKSHINHTQYTQITLPDFTEFTILIKNWILTGIGGSIFSELDKFGYLKPYRKINLFETNKSVEKNFKIIRFSNKI